jgi:hypothetical protein
MERHHVTMHLGAELDQLEEEYDHMIKCEGYKFNSDFVKQHYPDCVTSSGQITVNNYMQMCKLSDRKAVKPNVFVCGDITSTQYSEVKNIYSLKLHA